MHAETRDDIDLGRVVAVGLLVVVDGLELVLLLLIQIAHLGEDLRVARHLSDQDVVPLEGLSTHADQLVDVRDLVDHFVAVWDDRVQLLEGLQGLVVVAQAFVHKAQVVDGFDAISLDTDGLKEELLSTVVVLIDKQAVALIHQRLRVVPVMLNGEVTELLGGLEVIFEEV